MVFCKGVSIKASQYEKLCGKCRKFNNIIFKKGPDKENEYFVAACYFCWKRFSSKFT